MEPMKILIMLSALTAVSLAICWLDYKKGWNLAGWVNGKCGNPFISIQDKQPLKNNQSEKDELIIQLKERIEVLEKIVTEPSYELNQKLNQL